MPVHWDYTAVIGVYLAITLAIAFYFGRRETKSVLDFTVAGRRLGTVVVFFTLLASMIGAASTVGYTGWYWIRGVSQLWFEIGAIVSGLIFAFYLAPKINEFGFKMGATTPGHWMEYRYGKVAKYYTSVLLIVGYLAITAFQYMAMATILSTVTGIPYEWALVIAAVIVTIYTSLGGLWSVASTDVLQGALTLIGILLLVPIAVMKAGGLGNILASVPPEHLQPFGHVTLDRAIAYAFVLLLGSIPLTEFWQRAYASKDVKTAKRSFLLLILGEEGLIFLMLFVGLAGKTLYPDFPDPEALLPHMVIELMPGLLGAFFMACLMAVIMGTADSTLLVTGVMFEEDIYKELRPKATEKERLMVGQISTFIFGILVLVLAYLAPTMFDIWVMSADIVGATVAIPMLLGWAWKRPSGAACVASITAGFIGWAAAYLGISAGIPYIGDEPILLGGLLSLLAYVVGAYVWPRKDLTTTTEVKTGSTKAE